MKLVLMALYDAKIGLWLTPFFAQSVGAAVRQLSDIVNGSGDPPAKHPEDFSLWEFGTFDPEGRITVLEAPKQVALCVNLKVKES